MSEYRYSSQPVSRISDEIIPNKSHPYGKVYYEGVDGEEGWVKGVIRYQDKPLIGGGDVIQVALMGNVSKVYEIPTGKVGEIVYEERPNQGEE